MMQEAASVATTASSDYGPLSGLVQTAGWMISSVLAIGFSWRRGGKWVPYQEDLPKAAERFGGVLTAVAVVLLWSLYNSWAEVPFLTKVAIATALTAVASFLFYAFLVSLHTYDKEVSGAATIRSFKIIGGFTLRPAAKRRLKTQSIQSMLKDAAYDPDAIWEKPGRAFAQALFALIFIFMTFSGTVALSSAAMVLMITRTAKPAPLPEPEPMIDKPYLAVLETVARRIATVEGPVEPVDPEPRGYSVYVGGQLVRQVVAAEALKGDYFDLGRTKQGETSIRVTNDHGITWNCSLKVTTNNNYYGITGIGEGGTCAAGPIHQRAFDEFVKRRTSESQPMSRPSIPVPDAPTTPTSRPDRRGAPTVSELAIVVTESASKQFAESIGTYETPAAYDIFVDKVLAATIPGPFAENGALARVPEQSVGRHFIVFRSNNVSHTCSVDVSSTATFYVVTRISNGCQAAPMTKHTFGEFLRRTGRDASQAAVGGIQSPPPPQPTTAERKALFAKELTTITDVARAESLLRIVFEHGNNSLRGLSGDALISLLKTESEDVSDKELALFESQFRRSTK